MSTTHLQSSGRKKSSYLGSGRGIVFFFFFVAEIILYKCNFILKFSHYLKLFLSCSDVGVDVISSTQCARTRGGGGGWHSAALYPPPAPLSTPPPHPTPLPPRNIRPNIRKQLYPMSGHAVGPPLTQWQRTPGGLDPEIWNENHNVSILPKAFL